jgi:ABC-type uncharacterized transport system involved in gliding motility auxiliary subunit
MNRAIRAIIGAILVLVITFAAVSICQNLGGSLKADITGQKIYTLSAGTRAILAKLNQPINVKLYYAKTAALKAPDQIRYFNNYYEFVKALLQGYVADSKGMVKLEIIDPRPFSEDEVEALRYGLRRFAITEEENFFFGLVVQTEFGVEKVIPFFSPDRQNFVEYDISQLIDAAITRQKTRIGIMSSLPVMGQEVSPYMAQMMRLQGQQPPPPWTIVEQLRSKYEVSEVPTDANDINNVDVLLVIHPKDLPERTQFAIDQFVLKGGRTIVCVDPYCVVDQPDRMQMQMGRSVSQSSNLPKLLRTWGLEMAENTFGGDRTLALMQRETRQKIIGYLGLRPEWKCFNTDNVITANLNEVKLVFAGVLTEVTDVNQPAEKDEDKKGSANEIIRTPLLVTTDKGNTWKVTDPYELTFLDPSRLMQRFIDGTEPIAMSYMVTGRLKSSFPQGIEIEVESTPDESKESSDQPEDPNKQKKTKKRITGLKEPTEQCAVVVFADVDFISDLPGVAYEPWFFGKRIVGDNSALLLNTIDKLSGSSDLISIRSRGNFQRPFEVVDEIEKQAEAETGQERTRYTAEIVALKRQAQTIRDSADEEEGVVGKSRLQKEREIQAKIAEATEQLRQVNMIRRERIEHLGNRLRNFNMLFCPTVILAVAVVLGVRRSVRKRHYISHASDA